MVHLDYIVVGLGIAGLHVSDILMRRGKKICVIDPCVRSASRAAAGIINPITGRKYTKSWMIDEILPAAKEAYENLQNLLGISILYERDIIRPLRTVMEENTWFHRMADAEYSQYIGHENTMPDLGISLLPPFSYGRIRGALQVDTELLLDAYSKYLKTSSRFRTERFDYNRLQKDGERWVYGDLSASFVIFCEGHHMVQNPYFKYIPIEATKGEVLLIKSDYHAGWTIRDKCFVAPVEGGCWVGSGYDKGNSSEEPTKEGRQQLESTLQKFFLSSYEVYDHKAGVRPCTRDRKPIVGRHPEEPGLVLFNGMGTKGTSLAPYFAQCLINHLEDEAIVPAEVDISRFAFNHAEI